MEEEKYSWMTENEDDTWTINTKKGDFIIKEVSEEVMQQCERKSEKLKSSLINVLAPKCIVSPATTDEEYLNLPASVTMKLKYSVMSINGMVDFL